MAARCSNPRHLATSWHPLLIFLDPSLRDRFLYAPQCLTFEVHMPQIAQKRAYLCVIVHFRLSTSSISVNDMSGKLGSLLAYLWKLMSRMRCFLVLMCLAGFTACATGTVDEFSEGGTIRLLRRVHSSAPRNRTQLMDPVTFFHRATSKRNRRPRIARPMTHLTRTVQNPVIRTRRNVAATEACTIHRQRCVRR